MRHGHASLHSCLDCGDADRLAERLASVMALMPLNLLSTISTDAGDGGVVEEGVLFRIQLTALGGCCSFLRRCARMRCRIVPLMPRLMMMNKMQKMHSAPWGVGAVIRGGAR